MTSEQMQELGRALERAGEQLTADGHMLILQGQQLQRGRIVVRDEPAAVREAPLPAGPEVTG
jgi:hypothetical protein